jgi:hypothetical protein
MLVNKKLYFPSPNDLNDPYDCKIDIYDALSVAIDNAPPNIVTKLKEFLKVEGLLTKINTDARSAGVLSLASSPIDMKMWAHYAGNHGGFCLGFQFSDRILTYNAEERIVGTTPVYYSATNPFIDFFTELGESREIPSFEAFWMGLLNRSLIAKSIVWKDEGEFRIVRADPGFVSFEPAEVKEIIFGIAMDSEYRKTITNILSGPSWQHLKYFEIVRDSYGYQLKRIPIEAKI